MDASGRKVIAARAGLVGRSGFGLVLNAVGVRSRRALELRKLILDDRAIGLAPPIFFEVVTSNEVAFFHIAENEWRPVVGAAGGGDRFGVGQRERLVGGLVVDETEGELLEVV
jgi:hypothetical protein